MGASCYCLKKRENLRVRNEEQKISFKFGPKLKKFNSVQDSFSSYKTDAQFARVDDKAKSKNDINFIKIALSKHFIFTDLTSEQREMVIHRMKYYSLDSNEIVFCQGSVGFIFFIIVKGTLEVIKDGVVVNVLHPQESFGEIALIHDTPRTATIKTIESSSLWGLDRETFRSTLDQLNAQEYSENRKLIESIPVFRLLSSYQLENLISNIKVSLFAQGDAIIKEGEFGDLLYIIKQGSCNCTIEGKHKRVYEKGEYFGEKSLLGSENRRTATITASENVKCLAIGRNELTELFGTSLELIVHKNTEKIALDSSEYFSKLRKTQCDKIINSTVIKGFKPGERVLEKGVSKKIVFVLKGSVFSENRRFKVYDIIGVEEMANGVDCVVEADFFADEEVDIGEIDSNQVIEIIGGDYNNAIRDNETIRLLKKVRIFESFSEEQLEKILKVLIPQNFPANFTIFSENDPGDSLFLIKEGSVEIIKNSQVVRTVTKNDCFGERCLVLNKTRSATVRTRTEVSCWVILKSSFSIFLNQKLRNLLEHRILHQNDSIKLSDLQIVKLIGKGNFGNVFLVAHKLTKTPFALKTVKKNKIQAYEIENDILLERKIWLQLDHVLTAKLVKTFRDENRVYFLCEFINGINMLEVSKKLELVAVSDCKFYMACIFSVLEHLHDRKIVYRDLCPDNLMVDVEGYPKLVDFGSAKIVDGRTYTIVAASPFYMAPEVVKGFGYTVSADYWSAGVILYEFLYSCLPFGAKEEDPYRIYESVLKNDLVFPKNENKDKVNELVAQLLNRNPGSRMPGGFEKLKDHPWFISINWSQLIKKLLPAPYKPVLPSLTEEIEEAFHQKRRLENFIKDIEKNQVTHKIRITAGRVKSDWDDEFDN